MNDPPAKREASVSPFPGGEDFLLLQSFKSENPKHDHVKLDEKILM